MNRKFIITDKTGKVEFIHYMPFSPKHGLGKTEEELLETGVLLDEIPEPEQIDGKMPVAYYTPEKGFWYEYVNVEPTEQLYTLDEAAAIIAEEVVDNE